VTAPAAREAFGPGWFAAPLLAGLAAALGIVAVIAPVVALAGAVGLVFVVLAMRNLAVGVSLFTVLTFFEEIPGLQGSGLSVTKLAGGVLVCSWLLIVTRRQSGSRLLIREQPALAAVAIVFVAWATASRLWATDIAAAGGDAQRLAMSVILVFVVFTAIREPRHVTWVVAAYLAGALLSALIGIVATSPDGGADFEPRRLEGGLADPNELAAILVPALAFATFALAAFRGSLARLALGAGVTVFAIALFLTESRGGLIGLAVTLVAAVLFAGRVRPHALAVVLIVSGLGISYYTLVAPPESLERVTEFSSGGGTGRTDLWAVATEMIRDRPVAGVGLGNFQVVEPSYASGTINLPNVELIVDTPKVVHNTYLHVFAELGLVGFAAFMALIVGSLTLAVRSIRDFGRSGDVRSEILARGFLVGLFGMLTSYAFISAQFEKQLWLLLGVAAALSSVARLREEPETAPHELSSPPALVSAR